VHYQPNIKSADGGDNKHKPRHNQPDLQLTPDPLLDRRPAYWAGKAAIVYLDPAFATTDQGHILFLL
jgi:hypothetical protein